VAIRVVDSKTKIRESITYEQLWQESGYLACHLLKEDIQKGDRVMIVYPLNAQIEYMACFIACMRIGAILVSIYPPNPKNLGPDLIKFEKFVHNAGGTKVLTTSEYKRFVQVSSITKKWVIPVKNWIATDKLMKKKVDMNQFVNVIAKDDDLVFIQYTSGSTGILILI
jgi:acyl-CoA synthetase (AMP-forming)/AMP-acid ligase II